MSHKEVYLYLPVRHVDSEFSRIIGYTSSFLLHIIPLFAVMAGFGSYKEPAFNEQIYSVTIDAGTTLGGRSQVPEKKDSVKAPPKNVSSNTTKREEIKIEKVKKQEMEKPPEVSKDLVSLAEVKATPTPPTPKATPKSTATPKPTPKATPTPNQSEISDKEYQKALQRYLGESASAGGTGFGAAKVGGKGMGGGTIRSPEFIRYNNLLNAHIRRGWSWFDKNARLTARVNFRIAPNGDISGVVLSESSGNREFDESVLRAVYKANPVPPPPESEYESFKEVRILFDPRDL